MWRPNSLKEAIDVDTSIQFKVNRHGVPLCPNCGVARPAEVMIDVRPLPISEDFACDACWTKWERTERVVDGGGPISGRFDWRARWAIAHGAPQSIIDKFIEMKALSAAKIEV